MAKLKRKFSGHQPVVFPAVPASAVTGDSSVFTQEDVCAMGREYADLTAQIKLMEERRKFLATQIKAGAEQFGTKDDKGSFYLESEDYVIGKVARKSFKLNQEKAISVLKRIGLGDVFDVVEVVNEDRLNTAVQDGRIDISVVESFTDCSTSYAVKVDRKEAVDAEVEQTEFSVVARKK